MGVDDNVGIIRVKLLNLLPDFLNRYVVIGRQPLGDDRAAAVGGSPAENRPRVAEIRDVQNVVGYGSDQATRTHRRDLRLRRQRPLHQVQELLLRRVERLLYHLLR